MHPAAIPPGDQHRNKAETAVIPLHAHTGISAEASDAEARPKTAASPRRGCGSSRAGDRDAGLSRGPV